MVRIAMHTDVLDEVSAMIGEAAPDGIELVGMDGRARGADLATVAGAIRWDLDDDGLRRLLAEGRELRWLHSVGAGVESWPLAELAERGIVLTNAAGVWAVPIAEWVLASMLDVVKQTAAVRDAQRRHEWTTPPGLDELCGRTLLILGGGGIGQEVIRRAAAFGMVIWAANRSGRPVPGAARTVSGDGWLELLPEADFVVSTLPATPETRDLVDASVLARFKPTAWLLNVGRGATVDQPALIEALRAGRLGGAVLDVWTPEPLPADDPAWDVPNLVVSPHVSGTSAAGRGRSLRLFADNIVRFAAGQPLRNVVDLSVGY